MPKIEFREVEKSTVDVVHINYDTFNWDDIDYKDRYGEMQCLSIPQVFSLETIHSLLGIEQK